MPLDPCFADLKNPRKVLQPARPGVSLADFRRVTAAIPAAIVGPPLPEVISLSADSAARPISLRLYRPKIDMLLPVIVFFHGGGFVIGSIDTHDALCRELALQSGAAVVSVEYRLAPETPFPGPLEDCHGALTWVAEHAAEIGIDPKRLALCGDSAGGNLAVATALLARQHGPSVRYLGLIYPTLDPACDSESAHAFAAGPVLSREALCWFWDCYTGDRQAPPNPLAAIFHADLTGLPPTSLLTAEFDPLRDEGEAFGSRLRELDIPVIGRRYLGMPHGFASMPDRTPVAAQAISDLASDIARYL